MPAISIIIPCYNQEKYIKECLDSVIAQTFKDYEAIIINDGSTDNSQKIIEQYTNKYPNLRLIIQSNQGVVSARNNAIKTAKGEYIFPLDSDDKITSNCLEVLYDFITTNDYAIVCPRATRFGNKNGPMCQPKPSAWNMYSRRSGIIISSLFAKKYWEKYGGYSHDFDKGWEDFDFWLNFIDDKQKVIILNDYLFYYRCKSIEESRDMQANKKQTAKLLFANLKKRHPKMRFVSIINSIFRFFFYRKITTKGYLKVRIFRIPIYWRKVAQ